MSLHCVRLTGCLLRGNMELKFSKRMINEVDHCDLETFLAAYFGLEQFEIAEVDNSDVHRYTVLNQEADDSIDIPKIVSTGECDVYELDQVLNQACYDGKLGEGEYTVFFSW